AVARWGEDPPRAAPGKIGKCLSATARIPRRRGPAVVWLKPGPALLRGQSVPAALAPALGAHSGGSRRLGKLEPGYPLHRGELCQLWGVFCQRLIANSCVLFW